MGTVSFEQVSPCGEGETQEEAIASLQAQVNFILDAVLVLNSVTYETEEVIIDLS